MTSTFYTTLRVSGSAAFPWRASIGRSYQAISVQSRMRRLCSEKTTRLVKEDSPTTGISSTLSIEALSGRNGRRYWSPGPLPRAFHYRPASVIDVRGALSGGPADIFVRFDRSSAASDGELGLGRISARDGGILWEIELRNAGTTPTPSRPGDRGGDRPGGLGVGWSRAQRRHPDWSWTWHRSTFQRRGAPDRLIESKQHPRPAILRPVCPANPSMFYVPGAAIYGSASAG